jgi:uncharacterized membrane protein
MNKLILAKTISWHLVHITMVGTIGYFVTGSLKLAAVLASVEMFAETFVYFAHESVWHKIRSKKNV